MAVYQLLRLERKKGVTKSVTSNSELFILIAIAEPIEAIKII